MFKSVEDIKDFQGAAGLVVDGLAGPKTQKAALVYDRAMIIAGVLTPVPFKCISLVHKDNKSLVDHKDYSTRKSNPTQVVLHWDGALSADTCFRVLKSRNLSSHFVVDNDGTVFQMLDPAVHVGWHSGIGRVNDASIGVDISNFVGDGKNPEKDAHRYTPPRPIVEDTIHGHRYRILGYYPAQVEAVKNLSKVFEEHFGIPRDTPRVADEYEKTVIDDPHKFNGWLAHYNVKISKWDVAGFPFDVALEINK